MSSPEPEAADGKRGASPVVKADRSPSPKARSPASDRSRSLSRSVSRSRSASSRSRSRSRSPRRSRRSYSRSRSRTRSRSRGRYDRRDSRRDDRRDYRDRDRGYERRDYGRGGGGGGGGYGGDSMSRQAWRQGDWECDRCRAHNFASRGRCYACGTDKLPERGYSGRDRVIDRGGDRGGDRGYGGYGDRGGGGGGGGSDRGAPAFKPGDWNCPDCSAHNFASRQACYKCNAPK